MKTVELEKSGLTVPVRVVGWLLRLALGGTFIFSGFSKAVDPYGTFYKIADYFAAFGWQVPDTLMITAAFGLFTAEFAIGLMLLLGCFRRASIWASAVVMAVMLPLSLWLAIANPVPDCGCFGDAFVISNWATFWKNVILAAACVWLLRVNVRLHWLITPALQWIALTVTIAYIIFIGFLGYNIQPPIDFRPYKAGSEMVDVNAAEERGEDDVKLIYCAPDGSEKAFSITDELPAEEDGWTFLRQEESHATAKAQASHSDKDLRIFDGDDDVTAQVILPDQKQLLLLMPNLTDVTVRDTWPVNSLYKYCQEHGIDMIAITAADPETIARWEDISLAEYPIYTAEDTAIKEVVRGNPALVYLVNGKIKWKQTLGITDVDALTASGSSKTLDGMAIPMVHYMNNLTLYATLLILLLALMSFIPVLLRHRKSPSSPSHPQSPESPKAPNSSES